MTRRTMAERKQRAADRDTRRESLLVLLSRTRRAVPLTPSEAGLLFAHVEVEIAESDELRRTVQGQQTALQAAHDRTAAAEAAIVEAEQRAEQAEQRAELAETLPDGGDGYGTPVHWTVYNDMHHRALNAEARGDGWRQHAIAADHKADRYRTAWLAARRDRKADRAAMADELPLAQTVSRVRDLAARMRAGSPQGAAAIYADRIEQVLTVDGADSTAPRRIPLPGIPECPNTCPCRTAEESTP